MKSQLLHADLLISELLDVNLWCWRSKINTGNEWCVVCARRSDRGHGGGGLSPALGSDIRRKPRRGAKRKIHRTERKGTSAARRKVQRVDILRARREEVKKRADRGKRQPRPGRTSATPSVPETMSEGSVEPEASSGWRCPRHDWSAKPCVLEKLGYCSEHKAYGEDPAKKGVKSKEEWRCPRAVDGDKCQLSTNGYNILYSCRRHDFHASSRNVAEHRALVARFA